MRPLRVEEYGAVGDGRTDDGPTVRRATRGDIARMDKARKEIRIRGMDRHAVRLDGNRFRLADGVDPVEVDRR